MVCSLAWFEQGENAAVCQRHTCMQIIFSARSYESDHGGLDLCGVLKHHMPFTWKNHLFFSTDQNKDDIIDEVFGHA